MRHRHFKVPDYLRHAADIYAFNLDSIILSADDVCVFDFSRCRFAQPMAMMLLAKKIRELTKRYPGRPMRLIPSHHGFDGYAKHIGYFRYIGWKYGEDLGYARGGPRYTPVTLFNLEELSSRSIGVPVGALINEEAEHLAEILAQNNEGPLFNVFQYALREIMRNSAEHSRGSELAVLAQYWPKLERAEIVIMDDGVGIAENLYDCEYVECGTSREAVKCALLPGVSGVPLTERFQQDEYWGNSGFGLYTTSRLASHHGYFRLITGDHGLTLRRDVQIEHDWRFNGTFVQIIMELGGVNHSRMEAEINSIIEDGEKKKAEMLGIYPIQASAASKMLASDYRKIREGRN